MLQPPCRAGRGWVWLSRGRDPKDPSVSKFPPNQKQLTFGVGVKTHKNKSVYCSKGLDMPCQVGPPAWERVPNFKL